MRIWVHRDGQTDGLRSHIPESMAFFNFLIATLCTNFDHIRKGDRHWWLPDNLPLPTEFEG
jgi:hypothetical protein